MQENATTTDETVTPVQEESKPESGEKVEADSSNQMADCKEGEDKANEVVNQEGTDKKEEEKVAESEQETPKKEEKPKVDMGRYRELLNGVIDSFKELEVMVVIKPRDMNMNDFQCKSEFVMEVEEYLREKKQMEEKVRNDKKTKKDNKEDDKIISDKNKTNGKKDDAKRDRNGSGKKEEQKESVASKGKKDAKKDDTRKINRVEISDSEDESKPSKKQKVDDEKEKPQEKPAKASGNQKGKNTGLSVAELNKTAEFKDIWTKLTEYRTN